MATTGDPDGPPTLLGEAVGFGRSLRTAHLSIDLGAAVDFARALTLVDIADREQRAWRAQPHGSLNE